MVATPVNTGPFQTPITDVNKDGRADIISSNIFANSLSVLLGRAQ